MKKITELKERAWSITMQRRVLSQEAHRLKVEKLIDDAYKAGWDERKAAEHKRLYAGAEDQ